MSFSSIITVSLNPAVDRTIELQNLIPGKHQVGREISRTPGGKGVNVSRTLSAMKISSIATGFLGRDNCYEFNEFLCSPLVEDMFVMLPGRTRENITLADTAQNIDTHIRDRGLEIDGEGIAKLNSILNNIPTESLIVFSGSLPPGISPQIFSDMIESCIERDMKVVVDTSGDALKMAADTKLFLAKPNTDELSQLVGKTLKSESELIACGQELCRNISHILISRGSQGAILITESQVIKASCPQYDKPIVNTVGCGDVMLGSFVGALNLNMEYEQALKVAIAQSSACAFNQSAAEFNKQLAADFLKNIVISKR